MMGTTRLMVSACALAFTAAAMLPMTAQASSLQTLYIMGDAQGDHGKNPFSPLLAIDNTLYVTTQVGGGNNFCGGYGCGEVFSVNLAGAVVQQIHDFKGPTFGDGRTTISGLTRIGNILYGTTQYGGSGDTGVAFKVNKNGTGYQVIHQFVGADGERPSAGLVYAPGVACNGGPCLYGTTQFGGANGFGTVFAMSTSGVMSWVYSFTGGSQGKQPYAGVFRQGAWLYGTTVGGGTASVGTVFKISTAGTSFSILHQFTGAGAGGIDGATPNGIITFATTSGPGCSTGCLYGTTTDGGTFRRGTVYKLKPNGSQYQLLHSFQGGSTDGQNPNAGLLLNTDGKFYGTTSAGGTTGNGTIFAIDPLGNETNAYSFFGSGDGGNPQASLVKVGNDLYGTAPSGGAFFNGGVIFKFTP